MLSTRICCSSYVALYGGMYVLYGKEDKKKEAKHTCIAEQLA